VVKERKKVESKEPEKGRREWDRAFLGKGGDAPVFERGFKGGEL